MQTNKPRRTRTTSIKVVKTTTLKAVADELGIPAPTLTKRYHDFKAQNPRKNPTMEDLARYQRQPRS